MKNSNQQIIKIEKSQQMINIHNDSKIPNDIDLDLEYEKELEKVDYDKTFDRCFPYDYDWSME